MFALDMSPAATARVQRLRAEGQLARLARLAAGDRKARRDR